MLEYSKIKKFIELIKGEEVDKILGIHKEIVAYKTPNCKRKCIKENLHTLCVEALNRLSKDNQIFININDGKINIKMESKVVEGEFINAKFSAEDWITNIILLTLGKY